MFHKRTMGKEFQKWLVYALIVIYALCYQLQQPIEPFLVEKLVKERGGSDATQTYGQVQSFFGVAQALGSLAIGAVIDRLGVRAGFLISFLSCATSYYLLSITDSVGMLFFTKARQRSCLISSSHSASALSCRSLLPSSQVSSAPRRRSPRSPHKMTRKTRSPRWAA